MKKYLRIAFLTLGIYGLGVFVTGDFNSANWSIPGKLFLSVMYITFLFSVLAYNEIES